MVFGMRSSLPLLVGTHALLLSTPTVLEASSPTLPAEVRGEVLMLTSELVVVKLTDGNSILFHLGKDAILDSSVKVADRVEVRFTTDHHVISVKKQTIDVEPLR
jgi:hypothetical protein